MIKENCEVMLKGKCAGCVGLAEKDWIGKEQCKEYKKWRKANEQIQKQENNN